MKRLSISSGLAVSVILAALSIAIAGVASAQENNNALSKTIEGFNAAQTPVPTNLIDDKPTTSYLEYFADKTTMENYGQFLYENERWLKDYNQSVFGWQYFSTRVIFYLVIFLVVLGILFSSIQFYLSLKPVQLKPDLSNDDNNDELFTKHPNQSQPASMHELELSLQGFRLKTTALGVLILAISFAFFYLYLAFIYPLSFPR